MTIHSIAKTGSTVLLAERWYRHRDLSPQLVADPGVVPGDSFRQPWACALPPPAEVLGPSNPEIGTATGI